MDSPFIVPVVFWAAIATIVVAGTVQHYLRHRETQRTLRIAIEKGDEVAITKITQATAKPTLRPENLLLAGCVQMAAGVGLFIFGFLADMGDQRIIYPLLAIGVLVFLIGASLLLFGRWMMRRQAAERAAD